MAELIKTQGKKKPVQKPDIPLKHQHRITSLAAPTQKDWDKLGGMTPQEQQALYEDSFARSMDAPARKISKDEIKARALKRMGLDA